MLSQASGLSGNAVLVTVALFKTLMSEASFCKSPQAQGSGVFGTPSSRQMTVLGPSCKCAQSHRFGLGSGWVGGGIPLKGGGGGEGRGGGGGGGSGGGGRGGGGVKP